MLRLVALFGVILAAAGAGLGIYDHQRIQQHITRISKTAPKASTRLHRQKNKQESRDIVFGALTGVGVLIAIGAAGISRARPPAA
jgi:hypothetical protein